jgi:hypothetical protein
MRPSTIPAFLVASLAALVTLPADAMFKCTTRDGTVLYQARPCSEGDREAAITNGKLADNDTRQQTLNARSPREIQERAVYDRELSQRRARCANYRETIDRQKPLFDSPNEVTRQHAENEVKIQERRMRDDQCASI